MIQVRNLHLQTEEKGTGERINEAPSTGFFKLEKTDNIGKGHASKGMPDIKQMKELQR